MNILVTGAGGFIGKNVCESLKNIRDGKDRRERYAGLLPLRVWEYGRGSSFEQLDAWCASADFVFNLAGVNRPEDTHEYMKGNCDFVSSLVGMLEAHDNKCPVMLASSVQASLQGRYADSEYGMSKLAGEQALREHEERTGAPALIYRLPNVYGKWCRPNYNSVIATFCNAVARDLPMTIDDPSTELELLYIDDLVAEMLEALLGNERRGEDGLCCVRPTDQITLGSVADLLMSFKASRGTLEVPDVTPGSFSKKLHSTYLSYLPPEDFSYRLSTRKDARGSFTELLRSADRGQVSVNISEPKAVKGQHWHHTKWEKFCVVSGSCLVQMRKVGTDADGEPFPVHEFRVNGDEPTIVDMVPGYTHNLINLSETEKLVTVLWCNECFDPAHPDTYALEV